MAGSVSQKTDYVVVGDEPFAVLLADDLLDSDVPVIQQMVQIYNHYSCAVLGVQDVPYKDTARHGLETILWKDENS